MSTDLEPAKRAGTPERNAAIELIAWAYANGYLSDEDSQDRISRAIRATHIRDLVALTADLTEPVDTVDHLKEWWKVQRDSVYVWCAGIPAGLIVAILPVSMIVTFSGGIGWWKVVPIVLTIVLGLYMAIVSVVGAVAAYDREN